MPCAPGDWRPTARLEALRRRAELLARARRFFAERGVMEVETPLLGAATASDVHVTSLEVTDPLSGRGPLYLQPSPEAAMKRLLAAGSGPIYQLGKAFRAGESGRHHNPEFTLLEWYRPGYDHHALMDEVAALAHELLGSGAARRLSYREAFLRHAGLDPFSAPTRTLRARAAEVSGGDAAGLERDACLELILAARVQPDLGPGAVLVYDFPASQAAMARLRPGDPPLAERFELFVDGIELANGYRELTDPGEQRRRFEEDRARRARLGLPAVPKDERLLAALASGLAPCAGVAMGFDRVVMLALGAESLAEGLAFPLAHA